MCFFISTAQLFMTMFGDCVPELYTAWRITVCRVWLVPWTTHCVLLPHLVRCMVIELWFSKRCIRFFNMAMKSDSVVVRKIINTGFEGFHSVMVRNVRLKQLKFKMKVMC